MSVTFDVVSIGTLARNPFWGEDKPVRTEHATTTLVREGTTTILVDPSLQAEVLESRLSERTGLKPSQVQVVFLTTWQPIHRRSLHLLDHADWLIWQREQEALLEHLDKLAADPRAKGTPTEQLIRDERELLRRCKPAPEKLTVNIHLFPSPGVTPGSAGLLLGAPLASTIVAGDAVISRDYLERGQIFEESYNPTEAQESLADILDIADQIIPGHDNLFIPPMRR